MSSWFATVTRPRVLTHVRRVAAVRPEEAPGLVNAVYDQVERDFGMLAPPVALHAGAPVTLAASWLMLRETLLAEGTVSRGTKEAVAAAVSVVNQCPYCVEIHSGALAGLQPGRQGKAVLAGGPGAVRDPVARAAAAWAFGDPTGTPGPPSVEPAELIGVAVTFHYLNRMVNLFLEPTPLPSAVAEGRGVAAARNVAAFVLGRLARRTVTAGTGAGLLPADLLPAAALPSDLDWATGRTTIADAFARAAAALDGAAERGVPEPVRDLLLDSLSSNEPVDPRRLLEEADALPASARAAGRIAVLTAHASYRVTDGLIATYRADGGTDRTLLELASWAALSAARTHGRRAWTQWSRG